MGRGPERIPPPPPQPSGGLSRSLPPGSLPHIHRNPGVRVIDPAAEVNTGGKNGVYTWSSVLHTRLNIPAIFTTTKGFCMALMYSLVWNKYHWIAYKKICKSCEFDVKEFFSASSWRHKDILIYPYTRSTTSHPVPHPYKPTPTTPAHAFVFGFELITSGILFVSRTRVIKQKNTFICTTCVSVFSL